MKNDVKIKIISGNESEKLKQLEEFKIDRRVLNTFNNKDGVMIVKWSLEQIEMDDVKEIKDGFMPW